MITEGNLTWCLVPPAAHTAEGHNFSNIIVKFTMINNEKHEVMQWSYMENIQIMQGWSMKYKKIRAWYQNVLLFIAASFRIGNFCTNHISGQPGILTLLMTDFFLNLNVQVIVD